MSAASSGRREELLALAARMFAERGLRTTTVRDIADAAGILSGSLYHHFDSKESMVDEILREFLDSLFGRYRAIVAEGMGPRQTLEAIVVASFEAIDRQHDAVAIYQNEAGHLVESERFDYIRERLAEFRTLWRTILRDGMADGSFRADLDVDLAYRFLRDTVWVGVRWYRPGGTLDVQTVAKQYLSIVLDGIAS
ncbi:MAG: TetR/AcrR family transcriptional regulator, cholesterol catabolism regulator [Pseudonocardiales bacterium]|jgi:AcrR family transcriptional regulator|nr:TetR/AcrR family transcriptional regulator, cholesterol catabolism regulator [Pseudonocardiales bacterium]MDT4964935.1 TetR/AcrR family transcriptional regulator, cholesterol catabolism regulator [Pseudonocardiales bacterium]MDT4971854.1 TetR/AcrR family transcriptional regulator, cholesterol catabolism regulator [Pseudonocardiales bacterium]MDT4979924.1 TetR/AcrR family transcriptional regulator, cholesterol catabolism regulator [Pseudonocardiales bacterium]